MTTGPLDGIRVLDLSIALTGPYACALLADQGASVIKVERPVFGDIARWVGASHGGVSALYVACNRGKRGIAVDLQQPDGVALVKRLAATCDVVVENFRPGVMDRLGLGHAALSEGRDDLVYASLSGFGPVGPYAAKGAYDTVIQAYGGLASVQADPESGEPRFINHTVADKVTALYASQAITAALLARERGRGGQHLQLSMLDSVVSFLWADAAGLEVLAEADRTQKGSFSANFRPFRFSDGWGVCTPTSDADFRGMCAAFGVEGADDPRLATARDRFVNRDAMTVIMDQVYAAAARMTTAEAIGALEANNVPCGVVLSPEDLLADRHVLAIGMIEEHQHPAAGRIRQPRHPAQFATTPARAGGPAPGLGEHTDEILAEIGLADRIADLRARSVVS